MDLLRASLLGGYLKSIFETKRGGWSFWERSMYGQMEGEGDTWMAVGPPSGRWQSLLWLRKRFDSQILESRINYIDKILMSGFRYIYI